VTVTQNTGSSCSNPTASGVAGSLTWTLCSDGTLTISGNGAMPDYASGTSPWYGYRAKITAVVINNGVTGIGNHAFENCSNVTSVTIPNSVTKIGEWGFAGCFGLTSVTIPGGVTNIGNFAFGSCRDLLTISVNTANSNYSSEGGILFNKSKTILLCFPAGKSGTYSIPNSVTSIGYAAFFFCRNLTSVTIPASVTGIGNSVFGSCSSLSTISVNAANNNYSSEGGVLFNKNKTTLLCYPAGKSGVYTIPNSVTSIGLAAFYTCGNLTSVTIPASVTSIGESAFAYCSNLKDVTVRWIIPLLISANVFSNTTHSSITLHVPTSAKARYAATTVWKDFGKIEVYTPSGMDSPELPVEATCHHGVLSVNTPKAEQIEVYSVGGQLLFTARKDAGKATFDAGRLPRGVLIVRGSSGWTRKTINN
jgi:hypothetical protein